LETKGSEKKELNGGKKGGYRVRGFTGWKKGTGQTAGKYREKAWIKLKKVEGTLGGRQETQEKAVQPSQPGIGSQRKKNRGA